MLDVLITEQSFSSTSHVAKMGRRAATHAAFNNPTHFTLPQSSKASCLGIVSLEAHSQIAASALCLCLSPGNDGVHMVHPLAWPTQLPGSTASPQRAGRWSPWIPEKSRWTFFYLLTRRSRVQVLPTRARNNDTWDRRRIVNNMR